MKKIPAIILLALFLFTSNCFAVTQRDSFVFSQIKYEGNYDPYPNAWQEIFGFIKLSINLKCETEVRYLNLKDDILFSSPFICLTGTDAVPVFSDMEIKNLVKFLYGGGFLFINNASLVRNSNFDKSIRSELKKILPNSSLSPVPNDHAIYKSFYLIRKIGGLKLISTTLEGIFIDKRLAVLYCSNDILGIWLKDNLGNYLYECVPGYEEQRIEGMELMINTIMYSTTGTYKEDVIHKPFLERKINN